ncbi:lipid-A-disaccharide synthase [Rhodobacteraceae bacterium W635]|uniref:lipid-A-disaccharide synthase n=1 Tax=Nioella halotolerans TaxID=2303578 RepID=UPI000E3D28B0|nr:lipid-A-disaccharide synthase [Rhodobacteraceae bacterium W635]
MTLFLVAGEASGDRLGAALMAGLKTLRPDVAFHGIGGPRMQAEGLQTLFPMEALSVMGLVEVLPKLRQLFALKRQAAEAAVALAPDALITIDSPDFCLRVARQVHGSAPGIRTMHYVAPSVWAWRPGRAAKMARHVDHVLALLPFEPPYMQAAGMTCDFVGHPVVGEPVASDAEAAEFRARHAIAPGAPLVLLLPGSRKGEVARHIGPFGETLTRLVHKNPDLRAVVPTVPHVAPILRKAVRGWPARPILLDPADAPDSHAADKRAAYRAADAALAASGTVSLELAASGTPMVIAYDMNRLSFRLMKRMARIDTVTLVNLVSDSRAIPDFLGPDCRADRIAPALEKVLMDPAARAAQAEAMTLTMQRLGQGGEAPGLRAARSVLAHL